MLNTLNDAVDGLLDLTVYGEYTNNEPDLGAQEGDEAEVESVGSGEGDQSDQSERGYDSER